MPAFIDTFAHVKQPAWHRMGVQLEGDFASSAEMMEAAQLSWLVRKQPAFYFNETAQAYLPIPGKFTIVREDTNETLGGVVGKVYTPFQNQQLFDFGDALARTGEARFETAGSLRGGAQIFGLIQVANSIEVKRRTGNGTTETETTCPFLLLHNTHDGKSSIEVMFTDVRVVCWNTLSAARALGLKSAFKARHTASAEERAVDAADALGISMAQRESSVELYQELADTPMSSQQFDDFAAMLLTMQDTIEGARESIANSTSRRQARLNRQGEVLRRNFKKGRGNLGQDRYDALNAVTQTVDYNEFRVSGAPTDKSLQSAWFGTGADIKDRTVRLLTR